MTTKQLSEHMQNVDGKYLEDALKALEDPEVRTVPRIYRAVLLAAAIIMLLALATVAMATNWFGLRELLLPNRLEIMPPSGQYEQVDVITLAGFTGSPESLATVQWQNFVQSYGFSSEENRVYAPGTCYSYYQVYDKTMADKLDEIAARYHLKLHTQMMGVDAQSLCGHIGGDFLCGNQGSGYLYEDGTFLFSGVWQQANVAVNYQMTRLVKGSFTDVCLSITEADRWQEQVYVTDSGIPVVLALAPHKGLVLAELDGSFVTINLLSGSASETPLGFTELKAIANSFDLTVLNGAKPIELPTDVPQIPVEWIYGDAQSAYTAAMKALVQHNLLPDGNPYEPFDGKQKISFALMDVNADGIKDLLLQCENTYTGGLVTYTLSWDEATGVLRVMLADNPGMAFYSNGCVMVKASHNQGKAGDFWPYTLCRYDTVSGTYQAEAMVDAWDKTLGETYMGSQFPTEADKSGTGIVYYVMAPGNYGLENPMDMADFAAWQEEMFGTADILEIHWQPLTAEAIRQFHYS